MKTRLSIIFTLILLLATTLPASADNDTVEKTYCTQGIAYDSIDDLKLDLLNNAKKLVINELFGEFLIASTAVENFVVTKDQIQTSSIGFVRVEGNTDFHNGDDFGDACVTIRAYITAEDKAKFNPEKISKKYCDADENLTTAQLITSVKEEAIIQRLIEYEPKLKGADRESLLQLIQKVTYRGPGNGFISDTQTYCATFTGYVVPVEIMSFLESSLATIFPKTCKEILTQNPNAEDGEYTLFEDGQSERPFTIYCHEMNITPIEYLSLVNTGGKYNFSKYASGFDHAGAVIISQSGIDVITQFTKVRIDPLTLILDPTDLTFAISTGKLSRELSNNATAEEVKEITSMNFGTAGSCINWDIAGGSANIDLRGTTFFVSDLVTFSVQGWRAAGEAIFSNQRQVVDITGGGFCGQNSLTTPLKLEYRAELVQ